MKSSGWFRLYSEVISDRKLIRICTWTGQPKAVVLGVWVTLLAMANESPARGHLLIGEDLPLTREEIAGEVGLDIEMTNIILNTFVQVKMLHLDGECFVVTHWEDRQFASDTSTERTKRYRERKAEQHRGVSETSQERHGDLPDTDTDTDSDSYQTQTQTDGRRLYSAEDLAAVSRCFEQEIGFLSPAIADEVKDGLETYPVEWIMDAIKTAARRNKRSMAYISGILKNWVAEGRKPPNGASPPGQEKPKYVAIDKATGEETPL